MDLCWFTISIRIIFNFGCHRGICLLDGNYRYQISNPCWLIYADIFREWIHRFVDCRIYIFRLARSGLDLILKILNLFFSNSRKLHKTQEIYLGTLKMKASIFTTFIHLRFNLHFIEAKQLSGLQILVKKPRIADINFQNN